MTESNKPILCPSAECKSGAILLGVVQNNGRISFLGREKNYINEEFVQIAKKGREPGKRFRFADICMKEQCTQWKENRCGIIDKVIEVLNPQNVDYLMPDCSIRSQCRWYEQYSNLACTVCPQVITNMED